MAKTSGAAETWFVGSSHEDGLGLLLQTETILPDQFWERPGLGERSEPTRRLLLAVLEDALITLLQHSGRTNSASRRLVAEAQSWISSDRRDTPFDFAALCDILDIEVGYVRALVHRLQRPGSETPMRRRSHSGRGHHKIRSPRRRRRSPRPA